MNEIDDKIDDGKRSILDRLHQLAEQRKIAKKAAEKLAEFSESKNFVKEKKIPEKTKGFHFFFQNGRDFYLKFCKNFEKQKF